MNKIDSGIHLVLTYYEAVAVLRAMADAEFGQLSDNDQLDSLPQEEATVRQAWDRVKYKIYDELSDSAEHAT
tara:strand:+ start:941 stop:1156 length:216 start_codon:yes stop_codon:yes gene_type:complete